MIRPGRVTDESGKDAGTGKSLSGYVMHNVMFCKDAWRDIQIYLRLCDVMFCEDTWRNIQIYIRLCDVMFCKDT